MATLRMMVGIPASGKSTFVKMMARPEDAVVSRDAIRFSLVAPGIPYFSKESDVFNKFCHDVNKSAETHDIVWADATHVTVGSRRKFYSRVDKTLFDRLEVYVVTTPLEDCLKNNLNRNGRARVPEDAIRNMYEKFTYPTKDEFGDIDCSIVNIEFIRNNEISNE